MEIKADYFDLGGEINMIFGQSHFIKTVDDLAEILASSIPQAKYAVAFNEASGEALIRYQGNDEDLTAKAIEILKTTAAGHTFIILLKNAFPIQVMAKVKACDEVARIFCATANPVTILTTQANGGAGVIGVIDGVSPKGVENDSDKTARRELLKKFGYKF
ncbi:MAG: adenosine-specific kinase [Spirochaetales bacterium]|nr:adenosine-specific kinase [Spirochaetales bacterium]MBQ2125533.1 adenosine-specific kinase [Spirochaetales bacterium]